MNEYIWFRAPQQLNRVKKLPIQTDFFRSFFYMGGGVPVQAAGFPPDGQILGMRATDDQIVFYVESIKFPILDPEEEPAAFVVTYTSVEPAPAPAPALFPFIDPCDVAVPECPECPECLSEQADEDEEYDDDDYWGDDDDDDDDEGYC